MDPTSALAVGGNVLQFVEFSLKFISKTLELYRAADGTFETNRHLEVIVRDPLLLNARVVNDAKGIRGGKANLVVEAKVKGINSVMKSLCGHSVILGQVLGDRKEPEDAISDIVSAFNAIASDLLVRLDKLKTSGKGKTWGSIKSALTSTLGAESEILELQRRLAMYREKLEWHVLVSLR